MSMIRSMLGSTSSSTTTAAEWDIVTTESGDSPSGALFSLSSTQDAFMIYVNDLLEDRPGGMLKLTIEYDATSHTVALMPYQHYMYKCDDTGKSIKMAVEDFSGTGVEFPLYVSKITSPSQYIDADALYVTGTINVDHNYPVEWTPETYRVTLAHGGQWIAIDYTSGTTQRVVYLQEKDGSNTGPTYAVVLHPGRKEYIFIAGTQVAFCCPDDIDLAIEAPFNTTIDTSSAADVLSWSDEFTVTRTVNVPSGSTLQEALDDLTDGDDIVIAAGSYSATKYTNLVETKNFRIRSATGDPSDVTCDAVIDIQCTAAVPRIHIEGIDWTTSGNDGWTLRNANLRIQNCNFEKTDGTADTVLNLGDSGNASTQKIFNVVIDNASNSDYTLDVYGCTGTDEDSIVAIIGCTGTGAGTVTTTSQNNLLTNHGDAMPLYVWGGEFSDPSSDGPALAPSTVDTPEYHIGCYIHDGATSNGITVSKTAFCFGCDIRDVGDGLNSFEVYSLIGNRITVGGSSNIYMGVDNDQTIQSIVGNTILSPNTTGTFFNPGMDEFIVAGNLMMSSSAIDTACMSRWFDIKDTSEIGASGIHWILNNFANSNSTFYMRDGTNVGVATIMGNVFSSADSVDSTTKNLIYELNLATSTQHDRLKSASKRNSVTALAVRESQTISVADGDYDANGVPAQGESLDWDTIVSDLSLTSGNETTILGYKPVTFGFMDAIGGALYEHGDRITVGPIPIREYVSGAGLYPVRG